jgi:U32 family peptidase
MEITAPGGDLEKIKYAILYGADAVYTGFKDFGLRATASNLNREELTQAIAYAHRHDAKLYLTLNAYLKNQDLDELKDFIRWLKDTEIDAVIVSDPGVFSLVKANCDIPIHISTQSNVTNLEAARFWYDLGAKRIVPARELSFHEICEIKAALPGLELECFIHGAMCVAFSGRCLLSAYLNNRSANSGACTHPCRWNWALTEQSRPGEYFPLEEDQYGSYIMSSKDLCLLSHVPHLKSGGIDAGKIEGRMKSLYYVAQVTRLYRAAHDADPDDTELWARLGDELNKVSHREYWEGFYAFRDPKEGITQENISYRSETEYCGKVIAHENGCIVFDALCKVSVGDTIEVIYPGLQDDVKMKVNRIYDTDDAAVPNTRPNFRYKLPLPENGLQGGLIRKCKDISS